MSKTIDMKRAKVSSKSLEGIMIFADDFYSNFAKSHISNAVATVLKKSIPIENEQITEDEGKNLVSMVDEAATLITDDSIEQELISLDPNVNKAAEHYLDSIAQIASKYSRLETDVRIGLAREAIESGRVPNIENDSQKFKSFMKAVFEDKSFSRETLLSAFNEEINLTKSLEEESIINSIKEKVVEDIEETEKNNQLFSDIIEKTEEVKEEYGDNDSRDGRPAPTEEDAEQNEMGGDLGGEDPMAGGDDGESSDGGEEGGEDELETGNADSDIPTEPTNSEEGYAHSAIHANRTNMLSSEDDDAFDYEDDEEWDQDADEILKEQFNYDDDDDEFSEEKMMIDHYLNSDDKTDLRDAFSIEEEEVYREIAKSNNIKLEPRDDDGPVDNETVINPYRGLGDEDQLENTDPVPAKGIDKMTAESMSRTLISDSLMRYKLLPNYSAEAISNLVLRLSGEKLHEFNKIVEKRIARVKRNIDLHSNDKVLGNKIRGFENEWNIAKDLVFKKEKMLMKLGLKSNKVLSKEDIISLSIARNLLNSYSTAVNDSKTKIPLVSDTLKLSEESRAYKLEQVVNNIFDLNRKARHVISSSDIMKAREEFMVAEERVNKDVDDLNLDEKEAEKVDTLQDLLKITNHKKFFKFDDLYSSYKTCFETVGDKIKLSNDLDINDFSDKVVKKVSDKRGFLSEEDIKLVKDHINGKDIALQRLTTPYSKFILTLANNGDKDNMGAEEFANVAVKSKILTTIYHAKEALMPGHDMSKDDKEIEDNLSDSLVSHLIR